MYATNIYQDRNPYPEPVYTGWSSLHWNATGMPLVDQVYTGIPLGVSANTCRVHWNTTGKIIETVPHWNATGEPLTIFAYIGTPLEKLSWNCPTLGCNWKNFNFCSLHWNTTGGTVTALAWSNSSYLEFTALQWMPVLLLKHVSTSTSPCACLWYEHHCSFVYLGLQIKWIQFS